MPIHHSLNYIEFPCSNMAATKQFYQTLFNWSFTDYGPNYQAFSTPTLEGGFYLARLQSDADGGAALIVLYSEDLEASQEAIKNAGGHIKKEIFSFPGGRRFHFTDPSGNELAIWSDQGLENS